MILWLFFTIFGLVLFVPTGLLFLLLNRFKKTIVVLLKHNGTLTKIVITDKTLQLGQITEINGKKIIPIKISQEEIYYGKWRRWIIKGELDSKTKSSISNRDIEEYLNNEDLIKLYLAGKFKETLMYMMIGIIVCVVISGIVNGYLTNSHDCIISQDNSTRDFIINSVITAIKG